MAQIKIYGQEKGFNPWSVITEIVSLTEEQALLYIKQGEEQTARQLLMEQCDNPDWVEHLIHRIKTRGY